MLAACLLTDEEVVLENVPEIRDVDAMLGILSFLGAEVSRENDIVRVRCADIRETEIPPELCEKITGVPAADLVRAARMYAQAPAASIVYSMGITQHTTGTDNVLSIANLAMLTGNVGKRGAGVNPLRGQNNVQGACTKGTKTIDE